MGGRPTPKQKRENLQRLERAQQGKAPPATVGRYERPEVTVNRLQELIQREAEQQTQPTLLGRVRGVFRR